jgi:hypothetical protein
MVKIVGQDPKLAKQVTCRHCGAINEYLPVEVRILRQGRDISGGPDGAEGFNCGQCQREVITRAW